MRLGERYRLPDCPRDLSPAIRPGLRCGTTHRSGLSPLTHRSPRPSGRGSVAASWPTCRPTRRWGSLPGHQAGAPLRRSLAATAFAPMIWSLPGHQAGAPLRRKHAPIRPRAGRPSPRPSGRGSVAARTPARTPRLLKPGSPRPSGRGSVAAGTVRFVADCLGAPLPGHQAGAPLRQLLDPVLAGHALHSPRPSGRGSVAALRLGRPRACIPCLSPAIRPGLRCGCHGHRGTHRGRRPLPGHQAGAPLRRDAPRTSRRHQRQPLPGHQAGAPLRLTCGDVVRHTSCLSPAIRPGLRCGVISTTKLWYA